jgi:hypothetical protein
LFGENIKKAANTLKVIAATMAGDGCKEVRTEQKTQFHHGDKFLAQKGLIQLNAAGSAKLALEGKIEQFNRASTSV